MKLFIAEKPDLAKAIADGMDGSLQKQDGYFIKGNNIITWSFGHILEMPYHEEYDEKYKVWNLEDLPFMPDKFIYTPKENAKKQLNIICDLIDKNEVHTIVNCGDADEEGQILIDEIIEYSQTNKPVERLLLQDLTVKGVKKSLENIKNNSDFFGLSQSGFARSQADWVVGLNLTRAYTTKARESGYRGKEAISVGRVQTPILGLIVARDKEHESHKESFYYTIAADISNSTTNVKMNLKIDEKITDENQANEIKSKVDNCSGTITKSSHEDKKEFAPLPYNLLNLQADCSKLFGYKPDKTLTITQSLRENHKLITYNRSDCEYLPENLHEQSGEILQSVKATLDDEFNEFCDNADIKIKSKAFNDANITAHYAIIPTSNTVDKTKLSQDELNVYALIAKRFVAQFYPPHEYKHSQVEANVNGYIFSTSSKLPLKLGFKEILKPIKDDDESEEENSISLENFVENEDIAANNTQITKQKTKAKPYYTMRALLKDLTRVSHFVKDEKIKALLKEKDKDKKGENGGIGTPATRSEHIKNLFDKGYIEEQKKNIVSTKKGRELIGIAPVLLSSPDMTALWYEMQKDIQENKLSKDEFLAQVLQEVEKQIKEIKSSDKMDNFQNSIDKKYPCPKCKKGFLQRIKAKTNNKYFWGCSEFKNGCNAIYNDNRNKPELITHKCPKCGSKLFRNKSKNGKGFYWACSGYKDGCRIGFIQDNKGKPKLIK